MNTLKQWNHLVPTLGALVHYDIHGSHAHFAIFILSHVLFSPCSFPMIIILLLDLSPEHGFHPFNVGNSAKLTN